MYPNHDTLSNVSCSGYIKARDQSVAESGVTVGGKKTVSFLFVNEHNNTNTKVSSQKARIFKDTPEEKQRLVEEKNADNIRKVLCKSLIQWF